MSPTSWRSSFSGWAVWFQACDELAPRVVQLSVHGALGHAEPLGDFGDPQVVLPSQQRDLPLPRRHVLDELARPGERDGVQRLGLGIGSGGLVAGVNGG